MSPVAIHGTVLFDLDGTIVDNTPGIFHSLAVGFAAVGREAPEDLRPFVGPPLQEVFASVGLDEAQVAAAVAAFRAEYSAGAMLDFVVYDGVAEALRCLAAAGVVCAVATSKPEPFAEAILGRADLLDAFVAVVGATLDGTRRHKLDVVTETLRRTGVAAGPDVAMVGDRSHDLDAARTCGLSGYGVRWGFGTDDELVPFDPVALLDHPTELVAAVLGPSR
ncbi:MAG: HAD hydrolase-like protein [Acidimicrobiales bacterium]|nr:HAD hydrolase-like protein [Acidimicrobiales bacterium]